MDDQTRTEKESRPERILIRGARVHNLKNIDVEVPLNQIVGITGVSGSGKSSLSLGVIYAEGSRRYLESLSAYTRRRMTQSAQADVDEVLFVPAALALHQRPGIPGMRSTFGTGTELLNVLRLMFSRLASHRCPNGHYAAPSVNTAAGKPLTCPVCGARFSAPSAEELSFNSTGACSRCEGTGLIREVDMSTLVPDESLTIDEGAVLPWQTLMWSLMKDIARDHWHIRTDVPFSELTDKERDMVFYGPAEKHHMLYHNKASNTAGEMDFTYYNAVYTVENALAKVKDEKGMKRVEKFLKISPCPECGGSRLSEKARAPKILGISLAEACTMTLKDLNEWVKGVPSSLPEEMRPMAESICESWNHTAGRLTELGLSYLTLDRETASLSTGERQRMQLARAVRNRTTGVMYVLDEPSIGLHPANIQGVIGVMDDIIRDGNSVILVDHDTDILAHSDHLIELGPGAGADGGRIIAEGSVEEIEKNPVSRIGGFLSGKERVAAGRKVPDELFGKGIIRLKTGKLHTVWPLDVSFPKGRLIAVTGVSGSGKTTMVLESLIPALEAGINGSDLPQHVRSIEAAGISRVRLIDAAPIGINIRSTVATYADVHDELRKIYAKLPESKMAGYKAGDFSYNTGKLRCPVCDGTGSISLDVQFLPDVDIVCPECRGSRYDKAIDAVRRERRDKDGAYSLPELMDMSIDEAMSACSDLPSVYRKLKVLHELGLGYLTLGEATPGLSGGEAQRLKLAGEIGRGQEETLYVFDEPTIGLHPLNVRSLIAIFRQLTDAGATVIVIEHDPDVIENADYCIDMGPGGGEEGGRVVAAGSPEELMACKESLTGKYLRLRRR